MTDKLQQMLKIPSDRLEAINAVLLDPDSRVMNDFLAVVEKYGTPEEINAKAAEARRLPNLLAKVKATAPEYINDLTWLAEQRDKSASPILKKAEIFHETASSTIIIASSH